MANQMAYLKIYVVCGHSADRGNIMTPLAAGCHGKTSLAAALCFLGQPDRSDLSVTHFEAVAQDKAYTSSMPS